MLNTTIKVIQEIIQLSKINGIVENDKSSNLKNFDISEFFDISPLSRFWTTDIKNIRKIKFFFLIQKKPFTELKFRQKTRLSEYLSRKLLEELIKYNYVEIIGRKENKRGSPFLYSYHRPKKKKENIENEIIRIFEKQFFTSPKDRKERGMVFDWKNGFKPNKFHFEKIDKACKFVVKNIKDKKQRLELLIKCKTNLHKKLESNDWIEKTIEETIEFMNAAITTCNNQIKKIPKKYHRSRFAKCLLELYINFIDHLWYVEAIWELENEKNLNFLTNPIPKNISNKELFFKNKLLHNKENLYKFIAFLLTDGGLVRSGKRYEIHYSSKDLPLLDEFQDLFNKFHPKRRLKGFISKGVSTLMTKSKILVDILYHYSKSYRTKKCLHWPLCPKFLNDPSAIPCLLCSPIPKHFPPATYEGILQEIERSNYDNIIKEEFVKGMLKIIVNAEGSINLSKHTRSKGTGHLITRLITISSSHPKILNDFSNMLKYLSIEHRIVPNERIVIEKLEAKKRFYDKINFNDRITMGGRNYRNLLKKSVLETMMILDNLISNNKFNSNLIGDFTDLTNILKIAVNKYDHIIRDSSVKDFQNRKKIAKLTLEKFFSSINDYINSKKDELRYISDISLKKRISSYLSYLMKEITNYNSYYKNIQ